MISSRAASLMARAAASTTRRCTLQPQRLLASTSQLCEAARPADVNDHSWEMEGHGQPEMDESLPFQTGVKPQLLGWLCFWTFIGLGLPWFQVPFFDYPDPEEGDS